MCVCLHTHRHPSIHPIRYGLIEAPCHLLCHPSQAERLSPSFFLVVVLARISQHTRQIEGEKGRRQGGDPRGVSAGRSGLVRPPRACICNRLDSEAEMSQNGQNVFASVAFFGLEAKQRDRSLVARCCSACFPVPRVQGRRKRHDIGELWTGLQGSLIRSHLIRSGERVSHLVLEDPWTPVV